MKSPILADVYRNAIGWKSFFSPLRLFIACIILAGGFSYYWFFVRVSVSPSSEMATLAEYTVGKGDITVAIESDGTVKNVDNVGLSFAIGGTVTKVLHREGEKVKAGEIVAKLDTTSLALGLRKAEIAVEVARANLQQKQEGATVLDIFTVERNLETAKISLQQAKMNNALSLMDAKSAVASAERNLKYAKSSSSSSTVVTDKDLISAQFDIDIAQNNLDIAEKNKASNTIDTEQKLSQAYENADIDSSTVLIDIKDALNEGEMVLALKTSGYGISNFSGTDQRLRSIAETAYKGLEADFLQYQNQKDTTNSQSATLERVKNTKILLVSAVSLTDALLKGFDETPTSSSLSTTQLKAYKDSFLAQKTKLENTVSTLTKAIQGIDTAELNASKQALSDDNAMLSAKNKLQTAKQALEKLNANTGTNSLKNNNQVFDAEQTLESAKRKLENAETNADTNEKTAEIKVAIAEAQLVDKKSPPRAIDTLSLQKQVETAEIQLQTAKDDLKNAELISPIDGEVMSMNVEEGETVRSDSTTPAAIILSENNFEVQTSLEEADIAKVKKGQKAYITVAALEGVKLEGEVTAIANTAVVANGIATYLITTKITGKNTEGMKEGMTAYIQFIQSETKNVLTIPVSSVKNREGKPMVQKKDGSFVAVLTGFTDGKVVEVLGGLQEGEVVLYKK
ncbi:MAG: HlyD family efflux transporter periplasmic adaptor subunit [Candidatus Peregrinibacteria bacterium]